MILTGVSQSCICICTTVEQDVKDVMSVSCLAKGGPIGYCGPKDYQIMRPWLIDIRAIRSQRCDYFGQPPLDSVL